MIKLPLIFYSKAIMSSLNSVGNECSFVNMWNYLTYTTIYIYKMSGKSNYGYFDLPPSFFFIIQQPLKKPSATVASLKVTVRELIVTFVTITFPGCSSAAGGI